MRKSMLTLFWLCFAFAITAGSAFAQSANLAITKTDNPDPVPGGTNLTYTITITNIGPNTATNVVLNDVLPTGPTFVSAVFTGGSLQGSCTQPTVGQTGGTFNCTYPALTSGQNSQYNVTLNVPAGSSGSISNTATVTSDTTDPDTNNNSVTQTTNINSNADMAITKTDNPDPVAAGSNLTYTITITNIGPATAQNVVLNDVLPTGPTFVSAVFTGGSLQGTCTTPTVGQTGGTFNCTYPALTSGQNSQYNVTLNVPAGSSGSISNTATVAASNSTTDPNTANNSVTQTTNINSNADMAITKTDNPDPVPAGSNLTYTITITNIGPATAQNVVLNDVLPTGPTFVSAVFTGGSLQGTCTTPTVGQTGGTFNCTYPALNSGQNSQYNVTLNVPAGSSGSISNTATVAASNSTTDPNTANNSVTQTTNINSNADMAITKTDNPDPVAAGSNLTYTITITNIGPATAQNVVLNDVLPTGPTFVSAVFTGGSLQGTCTTPTVGQTGGTFNCTYPALNSGQNSQYNVTLNVPAGSSGSISNTATVAASNSTTDPNTANNSVTQTTNINSNADMAITKTDNPDPVAAGSNLTYTITITNIGPATAQNVVLNDVLPTGPTFVSAVFTGGSLQGNCTQPSVGQTGGTFNCTYPALTSGQNSQYNVTLNVPASATGTITNTATVSASNSTTDPNTANNSVTQDTTVLSATSLTKAFSPTTIAPGGTTTLTFTLTNPPPNRPAQVVTFVDTLPTKLQIAATPNLVNTCTGGSVSATAGSSGITVSSVTVPASTAVAATCTITVNVTNVAAQSGTCPDANLTNAANNISGVVNVDNAVTPSCVTVIAQADLAITKTDGKTTVVPGTTNTYTIVVSNAGPNPVTAATVTDIFPASMTPASWTASATGGATGFTAAAGNQAGINDTVSMPVGSTITYTVTGTVSANATGSLINTATIAAPVGTTDPNLNNNTASDTDTVEPLGTPSLTKAFTPTTIAAGGTTTLTFTITNPAANNPAQVVSFVDTLPSKLQIAAVPAIAGTCAGGTVTAVAGSNSITVTGTTVPASTAVAASCTIAVNVTNVALQSGTCPDANLTNTASNISGAVNINNTVTPSCVTVTVVAQTPSLNKAFSPNVINAGGTTTLTFTIINPAGEVIGTAVGPKGTVPNGPAIGNPAQVVGFTDTLPSGLRIAAAPNIGGTCTGGTVTAVAGANVITVAGTTVPASGATTSTCTITVDVTNVTGQFNASCSSNPAAFTNASGNISGLSNLNNAVTPSCVVVNGNTFSILKVPSANTLPPNSALSYTITVTNNGPSAADGSILTDPAVAGFVATGISCTNATNGAVCPVPANVTLANLQGAGIVLPTFPANSIVTFQLSGTFTQSSGNVVNTAVVSTPPGVALQTQASSATVTVQTVAPAIIPTMSEYALLALMLLLAVAGATYARRVRR